MQNGAVVEGSFKGFSSGVPKVRSTSYVMGSQASPPSTDTRMPSQPPPSAANVAAPASAPQKPLCPLRTSLAGMTRISTPANEELALPMTTMTAICQLSTAKAAKINRPGMALD